MQKAIIAAQTRWMELKDRKSDEGATMVEYGLIVAAIAIVVVVGARVLGVSVNTLFDNTATNVK